MEIFAENRRLVLAIGLKSRKYLRHRNGNDLLMRIWEDTNGGKRKLWQIQIEKNIRLKTAKKERNLPISEKRNVFSRLCRKPAFDGNGKTFSFAYAFIGDWLSAFMPTTKRRCWKEKFQAGEKVKPTTLHNRQKQASPPANGMSSYHQQTEIFVSVVP